jgi:CAAX protease family protein
MSLRNDGSPPVFRGPMFNKMFSDIAAPEGTEPVGGGAPPPAPSQPQSVEQRILMGPNGIRAGWRLLIFAAIVFLMFAVYGIVLKTLFHGQPGKNFSSFSPVGVMGGEAVVFLIFLIASWIMGRIERRTLSDYGLPPRKAFGKPFWQGALIGFAAMTVLLSSLRLAGVFRFGFLAVHGAAIVKYGALWMLAFLMVGFSEEFSTRGYAQFALTTGFGFWPAAILLSACFGALHLGNGGESWIGALGAGSAGFLFCFILRRTGDLWMAIGFHMSWDWAETFFYGVPDSGLTAPGHMLNPSFHGAKILTGGSVGPEGSILCFIVLALCWIFFHFWLPDAKYPNPAALGKRARLT